MGTHTYATLVVSRAAYDEIRTKLEAADYQHTFHEDGLIDMHGIALKPPARAETKPIEAPNDQMVGVMNETIVILNIKPKLTRAEALRHAAWLVALAGGRERFLEVLDAVEAT